MRLLLILIRILIKSKASVKLENIMLRSQIDLLQAGRTSKKRSVPSIPHWFRLLWIELSQSFKDWKSHLVIVKPDTVIRWHRNAFKKHWTKKISW
jgi:hypothetical protein